MLLIPGIIGSAAPQPGDFESIATVTVGAGGSSSITFSSIPSTYQHLEIRWIARNGTASGDAKAILLRFNGDTVSGNYYSRHLLYGDGSVAAAAANATIGGGGASLGSGTSPQTSNGFSGGITQILDYKNTNKNKTVRTLAGYDNNGSGFIGLGSSLWLSTAAITSIDLLPFADTLGQYSHFALYGIKG